MELDILHAIQELHRDWLNPIMIFVTNISNHGEVWIAIAAILIYFKKTRKCGITMVLSLIMMLVLGNLVLKNLFGRIRPCWVDKTVSMLIERPTSYSFPSGHTFSSFAGAFTIFYYYKKAGILSLLLAGMIAFSRMYLFVHYPTDILGGFILGFGTAMLSCFIIKREYEKRHLA